MTADPSPGPASDIFLDAASPRSRRPLDAATGASGLVILVLAALAANGRGPWDGTPDRISTTFPGWTSTLFEAAYAVSACYVLVVALLLLASPRRRAPQLLSVAVAVGTALVGAVLASLLVTGRWPAVGPPSFDGQVDDRFPVVGLSVLVAALLVLRAWMVLSLRRLDAALAGLLCVVAWPVGVGDSAAILGAVGLGACAAGATLLGIGSPAGHPDLAAVSVALDELGLRVQALRFAEQQPWGARIVHGTEASGTPLLVKVYGRDAIDAHRAARWWRAVAYREPTMPGATRVQMVEHEALVTLLAERAGVGVTPVVAAAAANRGDALIVLEAPPASFADLDERSLDDDTLRDIWCTVARLHAARLSHGDLGLHAAGRSDGRIVLFDFDRGSVAPSPSQLAQDAAALLTSQALHVGSARAVAAALDGAGRSEVVGAQPYLQRAALPRHTRASAGLKVVLSGLSAEIIDRTGAPAVPPAPLVRVRWRDVLRMGFLVVAAYALLTMLAQLDWAIVIDSWADATWAWIATGVAVAQLTAVADSASTMSAVRTRLPLLPLVMLQYAVKFVGLAISATAGRVALNTALLRRFGEGPSVAVTASALDTGAGALVNVAVVGLALYLGGGTGSLTIDTTGLARVVVLVIGVAAACCALVAAVRPLRRRAAAVLRTTWSAFRVVGASPGRALVLLGSNLVSLLITAVAMTCMVRAIHPSLGFGTVVAVTAGAALFSSIVPVPGNVGVAEATITAGLAMAGIPDAPAFAIAVSHRIATSYLPCVVGMYSLRWLRREEYV